MTFLPEEKQQTTKDVLRRNTKYTDLHFYQKADAIFQLTYIFCKRFLPKYGDRTVDQMVQAARSSKQNIVEGIEDGNTSTEMELKLLNVARGSLRELREDYEDFVHTRGLTCWGDAHPRYNSMLNFCRANNKAECYLPYAGKWTAEEFGNAALSLCHLTDKMMCHYLDFLQKRFVTEGGIKERMYAARTGYRKEQDRMMQALKEENAALKAEVARLKRLLEEKRVREA